MMVYPNHPPKSIQSLPPTGPRWAPMLPGWRHRLWVLPQDSSRCPKSSLLTWSLRVWAFNPKASELSDSLRKSSFVEKLRLVYRQISHNNDSQCSTPGPLLLPFRSLYPNLSSGYNQSAHLPAPLPAHSSCQSQVQWLHLISIFSLLND